MSKLTKTGKIAKTYTCEDCNDVFDQKSHYENHKQRKIPCILKDKPLKEVISEVVSREVKKKLKEVKKDSHGKLDKSDESSSDESEKKEVIKEKKKDSLIKVSKEEKVIDYSYLRLPENKVVFELKNDDNEAKTKSKNNILSMIDKAHNILYTAENIEGEDALNDIMNWIFIKAIQPILSDKQEEGRIDLLNKKHYDDDEKTLDKILSYFTDLTKLAKQPMKDIRSMTDSTDIIRKMGEILNTHPTTSVIFTENNFIKARKATTIQLLLNEVINKIDLKEIEENEDVIGEIYEHIINGYVKKGSKLGQFFTPRQLMILLIKYKLNRIIEIINNSNDREIKIGDTCMGTGGWLVTVYNILIKNKCNKKILLTGGEVKPSTFQYGLMNLIMTLKEFPHDVHCESSLTHINNIKNNFLFTNPPFQTDKKFDQVKSNFSSDDYTKKNKIKLDEVYMLKDNSPPIQFLELDYYKLADNGLCVIVLPYGELFFGSSYKEAREHFMKTCNITDIILFQGGTFTHTGIKTCALIFEKDSNGTKQINFIQANKECTSLTNITSVKIEDINKEPFKSWYVRDYLKDEYIESLSSKMTNFEWIEFSEIFTLEKGKIQSSKVDEDENGIVFVTGAKDENFKTIVKQNISYLNGENIFISPNGNGNKRPVKYFNGECNYSDLLAVINVDKKYESRINKKYIFYFLKYIQEHIEDTYQKGSCNQSLDQKNFNRIKIPIPTMDEQNKIIQTIQEIEENTKDAIKARDGNDRMRKNYIENMIIAATNNGLNNIKKIGQVTEINYGNRITKEKDEDKTGEFPVYGGGDISFYTNKYNREGITCKISRFGMSEKNCVMIIKDKYYLNDSGFTIKSNDNKLTDNYLWNYLRLLNTSIFNTGVDLAQRNIKMEKFNNLKIPIPPLDYQHKMQLAINNFDALEELWNKLIDDNDKESKTAFMNKLDSYGNPNSFNLDKIIQDDDSINIENELENDLENITKTKKVSKKSNIKII